MNATARHRSTRPGLRLQLAAEPWRRHGLLAVCGLMIGASLGHVPQPAGTAAVAPDSGQVSREAVRAALTASAPLAVLEPAATALTQAREPLSAGVGTVDIPGPALTAYQRAAAVMAEAAPACELSWTLLAAVGRVESDHGRYGGAVLGSDGVSRPRIVGVALDGTRGFRAIRDSEQGALDGDEVWDRAVGPMQFLPTTWALAGVDGDGDGTRDPHDLDDAALAAGVYLCAGGGDLSRAEDVRAALFRYNHAASYVALVLAYEQLYRTGRFVTDAGPALPTAILAARELPGAPRVAGGSDSRVDAIAGALTSTLQGGPRPPGKQPRPAEPTPGPTPDPGPVPGPDPGALPEQPICPVTDPAEEPSDLSELTDPSSPPTESAPEAAPAVVESEASPDPVDPVGEEDLETVTGLWTACEDGYCLDEVPVLLGDLALLTGPACGDYDGDGVVEDHAAELAGLVDTMVVVVVDQQETGWTVFSLNGLGYLPPAACEPPA